jgi:carboxyl-terminal processing protease
MTRSDNHHFDPPFRVEVIMRARHQRSWLAVLLAALAVLQLHGFAQQASVPPSISADARAHLEEIIAALQREWLHRDGFDWPGFTRQVMERAGTAQTIPETYEAIRAGLKLLGDKHSYYVPVKGDTIFNPESPTQSTGECTPPPAVTPTLPADVGYVQIRVSLGRAGADAVDAAIRKSDRAGLVGWVVDMRNSRGGNMWPFMAAIGPVLGEGTLGFFIDAHNQPTPWGYAAGRAWLATEAETVAAIEMPHKIATPNPRVAVLTDIGVASSGEAIAIAFRARPNTRSFGTATCGISTAVAQFPLKAGGRIGIVTSVMADRTKKPYGKTVRPDEVINDPAEVVPRALEWLRIAQ